ncbi:unnamed protein product [Brachionus calyciflorus]|uniref:Mannosyltransferase n=1 Tax=Brachionus calyciflorus TaxID=104777 RepID=A0A813MC49_9BILA|nr:unnamed protein product [Brachionus calyciflorus]
MQKTPLIDVKKSLKPPKQWIYLFTFRIVLNLFSQRSYIHPDEFFQGVEIISGDIFSCSDKVYKAWEFQFKDDQQPIRNMAIPYFFYGIPLYFLKILSSLGAIKDYTKNPNGLSDFNLITVQANTLIYYPRLFMTFYSLIIDFCLLKISLLCDFDHNSVLLMFASSYITNVYLTRTFSNTIETILFSILIFLIIKSIKSQYVLDEKFLVESKDGNTQSVISSNTNEIQINKKSPRSSKNSSIKRFKFFDIYKWNYLSNWIGIVVSLGVFNRPTFIIYAFVPLVYWTLNGLNNSNFKILITYSFKRIFSIGKFFLPTSFLLVLFDTIYFFKIDSLNELIYHVKNYKLILTPYNFFLYNSKTSNLKEHGEHASYQHLIHCFLLFGFNSLILLFITIQFFSKISIPSQQIDSKIKRIKSIIFYLYQEIINNLFCYFIFSFFLPLIVFSAVSHKEPRFLLPLLIPICLLTSHSLFGVNGSKFFRFLWYFFNFLNLIIYGYLHQGGVLTSLIHIQKIFTHDSNLELDQHVIFYHTYMPPRYLVQAPVSFNLINNKKYQFEMGKLGNNQTEPIRVIYDLMSSSDKNQLESLISDIRDTYKKGDSVSKNYAIFLVAPAVQEYELTTDHECFLTSDKKDKDEMKKDQINYLVLTKFRFHITFEHLSEHLDYLKCKFPQAKMNLKDKKSKENFVCHLNKCKQMNFLERIADSFSLNLYQVIL